MRKIRPLQNIVVIEKESDELKTSGGIQLVRTNKDRPRIGKVLAVGPGVYKEDHTLVKCGVDIGDRIAYSKSHEKNFDFEGKQLTCVMANGILGILK